MNYTRGQVGDAVEKAKLEFDAKKKLMTRNSRPYGK